MKHNIGKSHYEQMLHYANAFQGYYGNKNRFDNRHAQILNFLKEVILRAEKRIKNES